MNIFSCQQILSGPVWSYKEGQVTEQLAYEKIIEHLHNSFLALTLFLFRAILLADLGA